MFQASAIVLSPTCTQSKLLGSSSSDPSTTTNTTVQGEDQRIGIMGSLRKASAHHHSNHHTQGSSSGLGTNSSILNRMSGMGYSGSGGMSVSGTSGHSTLSTSITNRSSNSAAGSTAHVLFGGYSYNFDKQKLLKDYLKNFTEKQMKLFKECTDDLPFTPIAVYYDPQTCILQTVLESGHLIHWKLHPKTSDVQLVQVDRSFYELMDSRLLSSGVICNEFVIVQTVNGELNFVENPLFQNYASIFAESLGNTRRGTILSLGSNNTQNIKLMMAKTQEETLLKSMKMNLPKTYLCGQATRNSLLIAQISLRGTEDREMIQVIGTVQASRLIVFYAFSNFRSNTFHTLELSSDSMSVVWCVYEIIGKQVKKSKYKTIETESEITCCAIGPSEKHVCICCANGEVKLFSSFKLSFSGDTSNKASKFKCITVQTLPGRFRPSHVEWHPSGSMLLVASPNEICLFDCGLNFIDFQVPLRNAVVKCITPTNILSQPLLFSSVQFMTNGEAIDSSLALIDSGGSSLNPGTPRSSLNSPRGFLGRKKHQAEIPQPLQKGTMLPYERLLICFEKGPICIFKIDFGLLSAFIDNNIEPASNAHFLSIHLNIHNKLKEGYSIIRNLTNGKEFQLCLKEFLSYLVSRIHVDPASEEFLDMLLEKYAALHKHLEPDSYFHTLYKRYFLYTLRKGFYEKCFQIAHHLNDPTLFEHLYRFCLAQNYDSLAYLSIQHASDTFKNKEKQVQQFFNECVQYEKLQNK
ncbi:hypothetical protein C9374_006688 [Naegleria lovaniensis]|uniref:Uncharacterized protein n=1 Tax=Naegleria lovaniensis TaxID=51637 RepID=A0AA88KIU9_NAELO|nr:uncharacterized protein C9374_006688 [Naegleria lovaniensis]KAG2379571.1 hypothetical protein C9374_006688 [Naegleria lovaniensis]